MSDVLLNFLNRTMLALAAFLPNLLAGIVILLLGIILGSIIKKIFIQFSHKLNIEGYLRRYGIPEAREEYSWTNILAELVRLFVIVLFLIPAADVWGLQEVTTLLNSFLLYLPNVFVAALVGFVGLGAGKIAYDLVLASTQDVLPEASRTIASFTRGAITIFVLLAVLNQLGVAQDLIRILFTGFVAMIALAGGIAFGLGGQDTAKMILESLRKGIQPTPPKQLNPPSKKHNR